MAYLSFSDLQGKVNTAYYKKKGKGIYSDFGTFSSRCNKLSLANARDFCSFWKSRTVPDEIEIAEFGVGNGNFAYSFLKSLEGIDSALFSRVRYTLCDISRKMLEDAKKGAPSEYRDIVDSRVVDASKGAGTVTAHYIRSNELLTDLPAKIFVMQDGKLFEVLFSLKEEGWEKKYVLPREYEKGAEMAQRMLKRLPEGYELSFNFAAAEFLKSLRHALHPGGYADIFDYGFFSADDILSVPAEHWNASNVREYGGQLTTDANFIFLSAICRSADMETDIGKQQDYVEQALGEKAYRFDIESGLFYLTKEEALGRKRELLKEGYAESEITDILAGRVSDSDDFVHMRLRN